MTAPGSTLDGYAFEADDAVRPAPAVGAFSVGAYLKAQRGLREMSLDELESVTRIPRRSLLRLESGAFDRQHDAFVRGFVRTVAVAIGLDPGDTLVRMLTGETPRTVRRAALPLRALLLSGSALVLLTGLGAGALSLAARPSSPPVPSVGAPAPLQPLARRDFVRELAGQVRTAPAGTFARGRALEPPPAMFVAPGPVALALDAVFPRPDRTSP